MPVCVSLARPSAFSLRVPQFFQPMRCVYSHPGDRSYITGRSSLPPPNCRRRARCKVRGGVWASGPSLWGRAAAPPACLVAEDWKLKYVHPVLFECVIGLPPPSPPPRRGCLCGCTQPFDRIGYSHCKRGRAGADGHVTDTLAHH